MRHLSSSSNFFQYGRKDNCLNTTKFVPFFIYFLGLTTIFTLFLLYSPNPFKFIIPSHDEHDQKLLYTTPQKGKENCDIFNGNWVPNIGGSSFQYTNSSCTTIPDSKNCFRHGREDRDFLNWKWKPERCELPVFDPKAFLEIVRGKTLTFVGDSVARNHMESLLCLLSKEEVPTNVFKDSEDRNRIWLFPEHSFTLKKLWTKFLVVGEERIINGSGSGIFDLNLDKLDENWAKDLNSSDYIIISNGHWFFRPIYLHKGSNIVACVYCNEPNITDQGVPFALRMAIRSALDQINQCKNCSRIITLLRTFSPSHFENGFWNTGGSCNRTSPIGEGEIKLDSMKWELRNVQVEEIERVAKKVRNVKKFDVLDVSKAMLMRPDGHPGAHWGNKWMKGYNDCVHWCLPGPIDVWNDFLLAVLRRIG